MGTREITSLQGRVLFHSERLFRSTGASYASDSARSAWFVALRQEGLAPDAVADWSDAQCKRALALLEECARASGLGLFRDVRTSLPVDSETA
jgi:hypothetical protein